MPRHEGFPLGPGTGNEGGADAAIRETGSRPRPSTSLRDRSRAASRPSRFRVILTQLIGAVMFSNSQGAAIAPAAELDTEAGFGLDRRITSAGAFPVSR